MNADKLLDYLWGNLMSHEKTCCNVAEDHSPRSTFRLLNEEVLSGDHRHEAVASSRRLLPLTHLMVSGVALFRNHCKRRPPVIGWVPPPMGGGDAPRGFVFNSFLGIDRSFFFVLCFDTTM